MTTAIARDRYVGVQGRHAHLSAMHARDPVSFVRAQGGHAHLSAMHVPVSA
jgi:hypothetical protein